MPVGNFLTRSAAPRVGNQQRTDGYRVREINADVPEGVLADDKVGEIERWRGGAGIDPKDGWPRRTCQTAG